MMKRFIYFLLAMPLLIACKKEKTVWETDWGVPLVSDTLDLSNLVNDTTLAVNPGGFYEVQLERTLFDISINDLVEIPDTTIQEAFTIAFANFTASPGFSFVNSFEEHQILIPDIQLKSVILDKGYIDIVVKNPIATTTLFNVKLPGVSKDGVVFNNQYSAPPGTNADPGIGTATIDLSGYTLDLTGLTGSGNNSLVSQITVMTDPTGSAVTITDQDVTRVDASFHDVKVSYARGYFGNLVFSDTTDLLIDALNIYGSGALDLGATNISFEIENGMKVPASGRLHSVSNTNSAGDVVTLSGSQLGTSFYLDPATGSWNTLNPATKTIEFTSDNSNIEAYLENLGNKHLIGYSFEMNPWGNSSGSWNEIFPNSRLKVKMRATMPLSIGMDDLVLKDTFAIDLNQTENDVKVLSGEMILNASNSFPFSADVSLNFLDANGVLLHQVPSSGIIQSGQFGTINASSGLNVKDSEIRFLLANAVLDDLALIKQVVVVSMFKTENPSNGMNEQMLIPAGAYLAVKLRSKFKTENNF